MAKRKVNYPNTIGFRVTDETWLRIEQEIVKTDLTPHDWCRLVVLDKLDHDYAFSKNEMVLFEQVARIQWLMSQGFKILAHGELTVERWNRFQTFARSNAARFAELALADFRRRAEGKPELEVLPNEDDHTD